MSWTKSPNIVCTRRGKEGIASWQIEQEPIEKIYGIPFGIVAFLVGSLGGIGLHHLANAGTALKELSRPTLDDLRSRMLGGRNGASIKPSQEESLSNDFYACIEQSSNFADRKQRTDV